MAGISLLPTTLLVLLAKVLFCVLCDQTSKMDSLDDAGVRYQEVWAQSGLLSAMRFGGSTRAARPCS